MNDIQRSTNDVSQQVSKIQDLEKTMLAMGFSTDFDDITSHHFAPGVYARELLIRAGQVLTGKIHKTTHLNIVAQGTIVVASPEGSRTIEAPAVFVSKPGTKRAGYALTDTTWITIHVTDETDLDKIEDEVIADSYEEIEMIGDKKCLGVR